MVGSASAALEETRRLEPEIILLDIQMPGGSGFEVLRSLRSSKSKVKVVLLTAAIDDSSLVEAKALKVQGIVLKNSDPAYLLECLENVRNGRLWLDPELSERLTHVEAMSSHGVRALLAPRERQLIGFVRKGFRNKEIAEQLGVTEGT